MIIILDKFKTKEIILVLEKANKTLEIKKIILDKKNLDKEVFKNSAKDSKNTKDKNKKKDWKLNKRNKEKINKNKEQKLMQWDWEQLNQKFYLN